MSVKQRFCAILAVFTLCVLFVSCGSNETRFANDSAAVSETRQLGAKLNSGQRLSPEEFRRLKNTFERYPASVSVRVEYEKALVQRKDWTSLVDFYISAEGGELPDQQKRNLAKAYVKLGRYAEAYEIAKQFDPASDAEMRITSSSSLFYQGNYSAAKKLLDVNWKTIIDENSVDEIVIRGMIHFYEGENEKALELLKKADQLDPGNVTANNGLSRVYTAIGDKEKASAAVLKVQESFDKLTEKERAGTRTVERLYQIQNDYKAKRYEEVIVLAKQLIPETKGRNQATLYQYLYNSYRALGKEAEAREILEKVKQIQKK